MISSVLADLGANVSNIGTSDHQIPEDEFFEWLKLEKENLPDIIRTRSGYAARFTAEAVVGLLEKGRCTHNPRLADKELVIDGSAREGVSKRGETGRYGILAETRRSRCEAPGFGATGGGFFCFLLLGCLVTLCFLTSLLLLTRHEERRKSGKGNSQSARDPLRLPLRLTTLRIRFSGRDG